MTKLMTMKVPMPEKRCQTAWNWVTGRKNPARWSSLRAVRLAQIRLSRFQKRPERKYLVWGIGDENKARINLKCFLNTLRSSSALTSVNLRTKRSVSAIPFGKGHVRCRTRESVESPFVEGTFSHISRRLKELGITDTGDPVKENLIGYP